MLDLCCFGTQALAWIEVHDGLAAWVQGIGSVAALVIAIWVAASPGRTAAHMRKEVVQATIRTLSAARVELLDLQNLLDPTDATIEKPEIKSHRDALEDNQKVIDIFLQRELSPAIITKLVDMQRLLENGILILDDVIGHQGSYGRASPDQRREWRRQAAQLGASVEAETEDMLLAVAPAPHWTKW